MFGTYAVKQYFCTRFRERNADELKCWNRDKVMNNRPEKLFENFFLKSFGGSKKVLTFASAFRKKAVKEEFFERFRYKQASSTKSLLR